MKYSIGARVFRRMAEQTEPARIAGLKEPEGLRVLEDPSPQRVILSEGHFCP